MLQSDLRKYKQDCIPGYLETKLQNISSIKLLPGGYIVNFYNNCGTILVNRYDDKECFRFQNPSPIVRYRLYFPTLAVLHEDGMLQYIKDIRKRESATTVNLSEDIKKHFGKPIDIQCLLLDETRLFLISTQGIALYSPLQLSQSPVTAKFFEDHNDPSFVQVSTVLESCFNFPFLQKNQLVSISEEYSFLLPQSKLMLALGLNSFQLWEFNEKTSKLRLCHMKKIGNGFENIFRVECFENTILIQTLTCCNVFNFDGMKKI